MDIRGEPREIALGLALGVFVGFTPTMGFQMIQAVFFAALLGWNKVSAALGVWVTNPLTAPFLYALTYKTGTLFYSPVQKFASEDDASRLTFMDLIQKTPEVFICLIIGGVVIGLPVAVLTYFLARDGIIEYRLKLKAKIHEKRERLAETAGRIIEKRRARRKKKKAKARRR